jgi:hydroxyacylglutathione hydrolase
MTLTVVQFRCGADNYGVLVHDEASGVTASIDAPDAAAIRGELTRRGWRLDTILVTHHHDDHVAGNLALKAAFACTIVGPAKEAAAIPGIDQAVGDGGTLGFAGRRDVQVIATPGHTLGHVAYFMPDAGLVFVGDTLFAMGCGRLIEGTAAMLWASLCRLRALPQATRVYCGHDYAAANARFALTVDPDNAELVARADEAATRDAAQALTPPTVIGVERRTNPFLRSDEPAIRARLGLPAADPADVFAEIRRRKDDFS